MTILLLEAPGQARKKVAGVTARMTEERNQKMGFWNLKTLKLVEFRPGIWSKIETGANLTMAFMEIASDREGTAHSHPFDQCGIIVEGEIEISIGEEGKLMKPMETYFIPAGINHNWRTKTLPAKILDVVAKQS